MLKNVHQYKDGMHGVGTWGVYEGAAGSQVSVMNLQLCVTVGTYNVGEVVLIKCYLVDKLTALVSDYV